MFEIEEVRAQSAKIRVVGVGGAGGNAVNNMIGANVQGIDFIAINTDLQVLETSLAPKKLQIGTELTKGLGAGSNPEIGRQAADRDRDAIGDMLEDSDMVFITAGMGGGTGTGASSVIASIAKEMGALTVAVITKPFFYEGKKRLLNADSGIKEIREYVDSIIVIPNDRISLVVEKGTPVLKSFAVANDVLRQAVQGISDLILTPGLINLDFADVKTIMENSGRAVMGVGTGTGDEGATVAAKKAISNPLLEDSSIEGAKGILINITGGIDLSLNAVQEATALIYDSAHDDANIIFGSVIDPDATDEVRITVIATGFEQRKEKVVLEEVKTWRSVPSYPKPKEKVAYKGAERILSKTLNNVAEEPLPSELMSYDDPYDMPAFMRKTEQ
ncbi:cell division protein FtsZ [bacterium BMS3Bbin06]|nr:cell division protein FtsZ [bacterium BMS3Abin08]GBE34345.1 cell division protein FtsZ [bacterium BMS3Bbin06]HDO35135.1 cell division protein FtsZ [Nitrospirota bacterium]HDY71330.1 cell division protein FtsZ [Nitrospirota bacterium]